MSLFYYFLGRSIFTQSFKLINKKYIIIESGESLIENSISFSNKCSDS